MSAQCPLISRLAAGRGVLCSSNPPKLYIRLLLYLEGAATPRIPHWDDLLDHLGGIVWIIFWEETEEEVVFRSPRSDSARQRSPRDSECACDA